MKKIVLALIVLSTMLVGCEKSNNQDAGKTDKPTHFAVLSDLHFGRPDAIEKVTKSLKWITSQVPKVDAIFVVGDITDACLQKNYDDAKAVFSANVPKDIPVYYMMGNHDRTLDKTASLFINNTGQQPEQSFDINGYPFITLSVEGGITAVNGPRCYSEETRLFLETELAKAAKNHPNLPIFVFYHVPVSNTVWGSAEPNNMGSDVLTTTLNKYPQIIAFSGHTHYPIGDERSIFQDKFTQINDGGSNYGCTPGELADGSRPNGTKETVEALIVSVDDKRNVEVKRFNTLNNEQIKKSWLISAPHDGSKFIYTSSRTGGELPIFENDTKVEISDVTNHSCVVNFAQGIDDDLVYCYRVEVIKTKNGIDETVETLDVFSQFWLNSAMPKNMSWTIKRLSPLTRYSIKVSAMDSFGQLSAPIQSDTFTTPL